VNKEVFLTNLESIIDFFRYCESTFPSIEYKPFFKVVYERCEDVRLGILEGDYSAVKSSWTVIERLFDESCPHNDEVLRKWYRLKRF
jgi:hypothetical protein